MQRLEKRFRRIEIDELRRCLCDVEADDYTQKTYTVVAEILVPSAMSCRYYGSPQFVLGSDTFIKDTGTKDVMHMMFDMKNNQRARAMEQFFEKLYGTGRAAVQL